MGTAILGIIGTVVFMGVVGFLISLIGRATNTTYVTRGGVHIRPYKTSGERREEKQRDEMVQEITLLNSFCKEFGTDYSSPEDVNYSPEHARVKSLLFTIDPIDYHGIPSNTSKIIISLGNAKVALKYYKELQNQKASGIIDREEYKRRGVMLLRRVSSDV